MGRVDKTSPPARDSRHRRFRIAVVAGLCRGRGRRLRLLAMRDASEKTTTARSDGDSAVPAHPGAVVAGPDALWVALERRPAEPAGDGRLLRLDLATGAQAPRVPGWGGFPPGARRRPPDRLGSTRLRARRTGGSRLAHRRRVTPPHWFDPPVDQVVLRGNELWALEARPGSAAAARPEDARAGSAASTLSRARPGIGLRRWLPLGDRRRRRGGAADRPGDARGQDGRTSAGSRSESSVTGGSVWVADHEGGRSSGSTRGRSDRWARPIRVGAKPSWLVAAAGSLFVTDQDDGTVARIDVHSGKKVGLPIRIARQPETPPPLRWHPPDSPSG